MTERECIAVEYFRNAPPRLTCTSHGIFLAAELAHTRMYLAAALRALDEARSELAVERAMRRDGP